MSRFAAFLLALLGLLPLGAQSAPVFRIKVEMSGRSDEASFASSLELGCAPCASWVGGSGGCTGSPTKHLEGVSGLAAIRPRKRWSFGCRHHQGTGPGPLDRAQR